MAPSIYLELGGGRGDHFHDVITVTRQHVPEINIPVGNLQLISILQLSPPRCIQLSLV